MLPSLKNYEGIFMKKKFIFTRDQIHVLVELLCAQMQQCQIFTFTGPLGAGKTMVIHHFFRHLGIINVVTSPTFSYVNTYTTPDGVYIHHFDLYRIVSIDEFCALGFDEYLYKERSYVCIEWPEIIMPLLEHAVCHVALEYHPDMNTRIATLVTE